MRDCALGERNPHSNPPFIILIDAPNPILKPEAMSEAFGYQNPVMTSCILGLEDCGVI